ncbi:hypothetical protein [Luteolibacter luteus]|uniref:Uncharacterized protein n=1 Tax=Luteolibacter luteus TaxID=2728835 RepID=A0A858RQX5_9BACT|nr:hypothetical protein [Luteolibacter luteus]QJE99051.1 hypothetical protein HHL09_25815 [Luteolibacter luteus]
MSSNSFQHRPGRNSRQVGDAPSIGHVPKMNRDSESRVTKHTRKRVEIKEPNIKLILVISGMLAATAAVVIGLLLWAGVSKARIAEEHQAFVVSPPPPPKPATIPLAPAPDETAAAKLVEDFLAARSEAELAGLIRPTEQAPSEILAKLAALPEKDGKLKSVQPVGSVNSRALQLEGVVVTFDTGRNRLALLAPDASGKWLVDFDGFDRYSTPAWNEILSDKTVTGTVRVFLSPDRYYNGIYGDDTKWACYGIASPDNETLMFGYVPKDGELHELIAKLLDKDNAPAGQKPKACRVTLEIRHDEKSDKRQFEITRVLSDEWAIGDQALDQKLGRPLSQTTK